MIRVFLVIAFLFLGRSLGMGLWDGVFRPAGQIAAFGYAF